MRVITLLRGCSISLKIFTKENHVNSDWGESGTSKRREVFLFTIRTIWLFSDFGFISSVANLVCLCGEIFSP
jgi:hypothetical protein